LKIEDDLNFFEDGRHQFCLNINLKKNTILTNSTAQHRQPDQHNNQQAHMCAEGCEGGCLNIDENELSHV
jgi:hypothetical protein